MMNKPPTMLAGTGGTRLVPARPMTRKLVTLFALRPPPIHPPTVSLPILAPTKPLGSVASR